jgi:hypothetical protein
MWAEITIRTKNDLPRNIETALNERLELAGDLDQAYDSTSLRETPEFRDLIKFWHYSSSYVYLIFVSEARTLKVHVETTLTKTDLRMLKETIREVHNTLVAFLRFRNIKIMENYVYISAEGQYMFRGAKQSFFKNIQENLLDNVLVEILIPLLTFGVSWWRGFILSDSLLNVLIAIIAVLIWASANAYGHTKNYEFEEL